jgi:hypothetical protein
MPAADPLTGSLTVVACQLLTKQRRLPDDVDGAGRRRSLSRRRSAVSRNASCTGPAAAMKQTAVSREAAVSPPQLLAQALQICVLVLRETLDRDMVHAGRAFVGRHFTAKSALTRPRFAGAA